MFPGSLSSASLVIARKTLVAADHMTTQNQGGDKYIGGGVADKQQTLWVLKPRAIAKNYLLHQGSNQILLLKCATLFLYLQNKDDFVHKEIQQTMQHKLFDS